MRFVPGFFFRSPLLALLALVALPLAVGSAPARAQSDTPPAPEDATATKAPILVLPMQAKLGIETGVTELLDDKITVELSEYPDFTVLARSDLQQMLELEAERSAIGCDLDSNSCLAEVAGAIGAQYVVSGRMGKLGSKITLTLNLFDSHQASNISRTNFDSDALDKIADAIPQLVATLVQPLLDAKGLRGKSGGPAAMAAVEQAPAEATAADSEPADAEPVTTAANDRRPVEGDGVSESDEGLGVMWWLIPAGIVGLGAVTLLSGAAIDGGLCATTISCNGFFDPTDFIGPVIMAGGVGVLGAGAATALLLLLL